MKQFEDWIQTAPVAPMRKFTCEDAMALAYEAGHQKGFNEGRNTGMLDAAEIAKRYKDLAWYTSEEIAVAANIEEAIRDEAEWTY